LENYEKILEKESIIINEIRQIKKYFHFIFNKNSYKKGSLIGEGSYGKVYQAFDEDIGNIIAIKEIDIKYTNNDYLENKILSIQQEIEILSKLKHKNIIKYHGSKLNNQCFHIFLEYCIGGSIAKMLEDYSFFTENVIRKYTKQILEGLEYLHARNVIHRGED
jgi:serine/threonine protein kinase